MVVQFDGRPLVWLVGRIGRCAPSYQEAPSMKTCCWLLGSSNCKESYSCCTEYLASSMPSDKS